MKRELGGSSIESDFDLNGASAATKTVEEKIENGIVFSKEPQLYIPDIT